jgi:exodeoxyribonuclease V beta subunit
MNTPGVFDLLGALPSGRVAIEASAGTGKTYTLAGLVVRYVAEADVPMDKILVVTFTRAAAAELRDRVRTRLTEAVGALGSASASNDDELLALLSRTDRERRLRRLEKAVIDFDSATITTIHGFAQQVLSTLGSAAPGDLDATLVDDASELVRAVCADVVAAAAFADRESLGPLPSLEELSRLAGKVLGNPGIKVVPDADEVASMPAVARLPRLVGLVVEEVHRRRREEGTLSFDDLLTELNDALELSPGAGASLRRRFQVALVDEFQDTDPVQWAIFSKLFGLPDEDSTLVMVADPKQAIYAFRGANVNTYLEAAHRAGTGRCTLGVNWRADGALVAALERLFDGATFGDPRIEFVPVKASPEHSGLHLEGEDGAALPALSVRLALGEDVPRNHFGQISADDAEAAIAADLADRVHELLENAWLPVSAGGQKRRRLCPSDIAVLVTLHKEAETMQTALRRRGIPAVAVRSDSVLRSEAAAQWRRLLTALGRPSDPTRARTAALTWFFGWSVVRLAAADDDELSEVQSRLAAWSETLADQGPGEFCRKLWSESGVTARVLATGDGDRNMTDLDHVAGLLQSAATGRRPTPDGLLGMLDELAAAHPVDPDNDVTARQVESEAEAVQLMTVYVAKGLEFPVVCVPTMWRGGPTSAKDVIYEDPRSHLRTIDIANKAGWPTPCEAGERKALADEEARGENLRLLYVALTRAAHSALVWWSRGKDSEKTGLARVLFARRGGDIAADLFSEVKVLLPDDADARKFLQDSFAHLGRSVAVSLTAPRRDEAEPWHGLSAPGSPAVRAVAVLGRTPDRSRRQWSFSAISRRAEEAGLDPGAETLGGPGASDEPPAPDEALGVPPVEADGAASDLPLGAVPGGAQFGTLVHEVLERVDFLSENLDAELRGHIDDRLRWHPWPVGTETLVNGLRAALETPLGPLFGHRRLRDLPRGERLGELSFDLRLGERSRPASDRDIGALLLGRLPGDDPFRPWARRLASGVFDVDLAGHLTGSIDMVVRVRDQLEPSSPPRFVVVDYKTNVLAGPGRLPQAADYRPDRLADAMAEHHYPLQALLYEVALHRYLRWRVRDYEPSRHLGGIAYMFVRGMAGASTPVFENNPYGVFTWRVPTSLVSSLSDLLDGAAVAP